MECERELYKHEDHYIFKRCTIAPGEFVQFLLEEEEEEETILEFVDCVIGMF